MTDPIPDAHGILNTGVAEGPEILDGLTAVKPSKEQKQKQRRTKTGSAAPQAESELVPGSVHLPRQIDPFHFFV